MLFDDSEKCFDRVEASCWVVFAEVAPPLQLVPATADQSEALQWLDPSSALVGIEGLLVKVRDQPYRAGRTPDWRKIRSVRLKII